MNIFRSPEFKVGFLVLFVAGIVGLMSMKVSEDPSYLSGSSKRVWFFVDNATGLINNSLVKLAGVNVGTVKDISLSGNRARIELSLRGDLELTNSSTVSVKALGFLGDKHIELSLGSSRDPILKDGEQINYLAGDGSIDQVMEQLGKISTSMSDLAESLNGTSSSPKNKNHPIAKIVSNIEELTSRFSTLVDPDNGQLSVALQEFTQLSRSLNGVLEEDGDESLRGAWQQAAVSLRSVEKTLKNFQEISDKINQGEGTIGKLINDDAILQDLNATVKEVSDLLSVAKRLENSFDAHSEFLSNGNVTKSYFGLKIQPGWDRYYELAIIDDPKGVIETVDESRTTGGVTTNTSTVTTFKNKTKFTALFAKNIHDFTIKGGLIESAGGVAADYHLFNKKLRLSLELFDFADTHVKAFARYNVWKGFYLIGGGDDLADSTNASGFLGAGLFLTNDDLGLLFTGASF